MATQHFSRSLPLDHPAADVFAWHERPGAFQRLMPPWEKGDLIERSRGLGNGARTVFRVKIGPVPITWVAVHKDYIEGRQFVDEQVKGPFAAFEHTHSMEPVGGEDSEKSRLVDSVTYRLPFGPLGDIAQGKAVRKRLAQMFAYRHATTAADLATHAASPIAKPARWLVSGASGMIGQQLVAFLQTGGHHVVRLQREASKTADAPARRESEKRVVWNPAKGFTDEQRAELEGFDFVVHLAGESIASGRWNAARKQRIRDSRSVGTRHLAEALSKLDNPPRALICASAIGFYGSRGDEQLDESSSGGDDYLADVCREWEAATEPASAAGIRVVNARLGVVLSPQGGALGQMLLPFLMGAGGPVGSGKQWMSWIAIDDVLEAIYHAAGDESLRGPINLVAPNPVTNAEFGKTLGRVLRRPAFAPLPAFVVKTIFGEMGEALLLASQRVAPTRLAGADGFAFRHPDLEGALRHLLGRRENLSLAPKAETKLC